MKINVDKEYYYEIYGGDKYDDIDRILKRAALIVDSRILIGISTDEQVTAYKNAVCAQAEYMGSMGGASALNMGTVSSFSIGSFSMSTGGGASGDGSHEISGNALDYLDRAGLLYRGLV